MRKVLTYIALIASVFGSSHGMNFSQTESEGNASQPITIEAPAENKGRMRFADGDSVIEITSHSTVSKYGLEPDIPVEVVMGTLSEIVIPNGVTAIGPDAFSDCRNLTSVTIPNSVAIIDPYAFSGCVNLKFINIPKTIKYIHSSAFYGCNSLPDESRNLIDAVIEREKTRQDKLRRKKNIATTFNSLVEQVKAYNTAHPDSIGDLQPLWNNAGRKTGLTAKRRVPLLPGQKTLDYFVGK